MTPAERIAAKIINPWCFMTGAAEAAIDALADADYVIVHCPKGERRVVDRTGDTDRLIRQERGSYIHKGENTANWWLDIEEGE